MDNIIQTPIIEEVEQSFLDYSLSVITDRAIPAVEDGCKPVVRRILWSMLESGYKNNKPYVKCARPVGDIMGKYHPHGDSSIYGALVGISQPWNMRYPLIDFHGNNGSRDGDGPAAMRYTECRLSKIAEATLADIKKDCVDWTPNFDETTQEPVYLPGMFPNLLCNGTTGIAVAMACSFAPHNLKEIMNAAIYYLNHRDNCKAEDLLQFIEGPDFPTGGIVINKKELRDAYLTGKGRARIRGEYIKENNKLIFTSIPYKISKESLLQEIDKLCEEKKLDGIAEIRDESNKSGVRFVIELNKGIDAEVIANKLYALTDLETTYSFNQVGLVNKSPKQLTLLDLIHYYIGHQENVFRRKKQYESSQLDKKIHILRGLSAALDNIDDIIQLIKKSSSVADAREKLQQMNFSIEQADAILNMKLSKLAHMEKIAVENDLNNALAENALIIDQLNHVNESLAEELEQFKQKFGDDRRTTITNIEITKEEKEVAEIIPEDVVVKITEDGLISRIPNKKFRPQKRGGIGYKNKGEIINRVISTNTIDILMIFTSFGKVYRISVDDVPEDKSVSLASLVQFESGEKYVTAACMSRDVDNQFVWFVTKNGTIKRTPLKEYVGAKRKTGTAAIKLREDDELIRVFISPIVDKDIMIFTHDGFAVRSHINQFSVSSRTAIGIKGINLGKDDYVINAGIVQDNLTMSVFTEDGMGKRLSLNEFPVQNRGGKGIKCIPSGYLADAIGLLKEENLLVVGTMSNICIKQDDLDIGTRQSIGKKVIKNGKIIQVIAV